MQNNDFYKKLRFIALCLAIVCMILSLIKRAKAESMADNIKTACYDIMNEHFNNYQQYKSTIDSIMDECPFVTCNQYTIGSNTWYYMDFYNTENWGCLYSTSSTSWYGQMAREGLAFTVNNQWCTAWGLTDQYYTFDKDIKVYHMASRNNQFYFINTPSPTLDVRYSVVKYNKWFVGNVGQNSNISTVAGTYSNEYTNSSVTHVSTLLDYGHIYVQTARNYGGFRYIEDTISPITNNTNGFSVFKYNNLGIDTLRIVPPKNKVIVGSHISNISSVTFDLVIDETIIPITYNSESEYYYESIEYNRAYYEIPFTALLPSSINDFNNVYITNVVYNNTWENQGGENGTDTFYYVDKVYLKQTIDNEDIGQVSITHVDTNTGYDETHITNIYNMITNASTISGEFNTEKNLVGGSSTPYSFTSFQDAIVRTVECFHPTGTKSTDWTPIITENNIEFNSGDNMYWLEYDDNSQVFNNRYNYNISPYSYIRENNYTGYYDILYFIVHEQLYTSNGTGFSTLSNSYTRYFYFISDRYYNKLILYREMDIMEYIKLNNEISEKVYNYIYDRLLNIDDNIYYYIKDKANIDNDILDALENIDNDMQFNFDIINDILNKILNALSELHLTQLDTIETKLNTIISNIGQSNTQNEDDTVAEAIQYYKSHNTNGIPSGQVYIDDKMSIWISGKVHLWLQGTDANTDKTNLINSVFDTLTSIYDSMKNNNDIFPNIQYYLDAIAKNNNYGYETHGDYMTRLFKGNVDISTYSGIAE